MRRREFVAAIISAAAWPRATLAQRADHVRKVGMLLGGSESDEEWQCYLRSFEQELQRHCHIKAGWRAGGRWPRVAG